MSSHVETIRFQKHASFQNIEKNMQMENPL